MKQRFAILITVLLLLFSVSLPALAVDESAPVISFAAAYQDGYVLSVSGITPETSPERLIVLYAQHPFTGPLEKAAAEYVAVLPLDARGAIVISGLNLTPGSETSLQVKAMYDGGETVLLSDVVLATTQQSLMPTAPASISFVNKKEAMFEGQLLDLPMIIDPLSSIKANLTYSSSSKKVATVDENGVVTAIAKGKATITAIGLTSEGKKLKASVVVTVNRPVTHIELNKPEITLAVGKRTVIKASVTPSSASDKSVIFSSSDEAVATVDKKGNVQAVSAGTATITAASSSNPEITSTTRITVVVPISKLLLNTDVSTIYVGQTIPISVNYQPIDATLKSATFASSAAKIATVDESGLVTGIAKGNVTITATAADGSRIKATKRITVLQQPQSVSFKEPPTKLNVGTNKKITAIVSPSNTSDKTLLWSSSNEAVATVSKTGIVTPKYPGQVTITATAKDFPEVSASVDITVAQLAKSITMAETNLNILVQNTAQLAYTVNPEYTTNKAVTWSSSRPNVASVDQNGLVTAHKRGTATITVTSQDGSKRTAKATINVIQPLYGMALDKEEFRVGLGETGTLTAVLEPLDASNSKVRWYSSNSDIARVSGSSIKASVTGIAWGDAEITAITDEGEYTDTAIVHIGDYNKALETVMLSLVPKSGGGYTPFIQFKNWSNMEITSVNFIIQGYDINNNLLYMGSNHAYVYGEYLNELAPGWQTESIGFYYENPGNYTGIEKIRVAITDYTTSSDVQWHISLTDRSWKEYVTPEFAALHPST